LGFESTDAPPAPFASRSAGAGESFPAAEAVLPGSREYDTGEAVDEGLDGGAGRFAGDEIPPCDGAVAAAFGAVPAEVAR